MGEKEATNMVLYQQPFYDVILEAQRCFDANEGPPVVYVNSLFNDCPALLPAQLQLLNYRTQRAQIAVRWRPSGVAVLDVAVRALIVPCFKNFPFEKLVIDQKSDILVAFKMVKRFPAQHKEILAELFKANAAIVFNQKLGDVRPPYLFFSKVPTQTFEQRVSHDEQKAAMLTSTTFTAAVNKLKLQFNLFIRKTYGGVLTNYSLLTDFSHDIANLVNDAETKSYSFQLSNSYHQAISRTKDNIAIIQGKMQHDSVNANEINFQTLLLWLFTSEVIPLCFVVWVLQLVKVGKGNITQQKATIILKAIFLNVIHELTIQHLELLQSYILKGRSVNKFLVEHFLREQSYAFSVDLPLNQFFLVNYIPSLEIPLIDTSTSYQITKEAIQSWYLSLPLIISSFTSISLDYCTNFNYSNLSYLTQARVIPLNVLINGGREIVTDIDITNLELYEIIAQFPQLYNRTIFYDIQISKITNQYDTLMENTIHINTLLNKFYNPDSYHQSYLQYKKLNLVQNNINLIINKKTIADQNIQPKKLSDFLLLPLFQLQADKYILNYNELEQLLQQIDCQIQELIGLKESKLFVLLIHLNITQKIEGLLSEYIQLKQSISNDQKQIYRQFTEKVTIQIQYCRTVIYNARCNPSFFFLIQELKNLFSKELMLTLKRHIEKIFECNFQNFISTFSKFEDAEAIAFINESADHFLKPITYFNSLIIDVLTKLKNQNEWKSKAAAFIIVFEQFISDLSKQSEININTLSKLDVDQVNLAQNSFSTFVSNYPELQVQFNIPVFDFNQDSNNDEIEFIFLQSIARVTQLQIESTKFKYSELLINYTKNVAKDEFNPNFDFHNYDNLSFEQVVFRQHFLLKELMSMSYCLHYWRIWSLTDSKTDCSISCLNNITYPSPYCMMQRFIFIYDVIITFSNIKNSFANNQNSIFADFHAVSVFQNVDKLARSIGRIRSIISSKLPIYTNKQDYDKQKQLFKNIEQKSSCLNKIQFVSSELTFAKWEKTVQQIEQSILTYVPLSMGCYLLKQPYLKNNHLDVISKYLQINCDKAFNFTLKQLLVTFAKNTHFLDLLLVLYINSFIDFQANMKLKRIVSSLNLIRVSLTYTYKVVNDDQIYIVHKKNQSESLNISQIEHVILLPCCFQQICVESYVAASQIINNADFIGEKEVTSTVSHDNLVILYAKQCSQRMQSNQVPSDLKEFVETLKQWRYPIQIEQQARDIEAISQILQSFCICLKRTSLRMQDLLSLVSNLAVFSNNQVNVYLCDDNDKKMVANFLYDWQIFVKHNFEGQIDVNLLRFVLNTQEVDFLYNLSNNISEFHETKRKILYNIQLQKHMKLVPCCQIQQEKTYYFSSLLFQCSPNILYQRIDQINLFQDTKFFYKIFNCVTSICIANNHIIDFKSNNDVLVLHNKVICPNYVYQLFDVFVKESQHFIIKKLVQYSHYTPTYDVIQQLLQKEVFEVFVLVINTYLYNKKITKQQLFKYLSEFYFNKQNAFEQISLDSITKFLDEQYYYIYYDATKRQLLLTNLDQQILVKVGNHWQGGKTIPIQLLKSEQKVFTQILCSLQNDNSTIMLGDRERGYLNEQLFVICLELERLLRKYLIQITVSQYQFNEQYQQIEAYIANGYVVVLFGLEFLNQIQLNVLLNLVISLKYRKSEFVTFKLADYQDEFMASNCSYDQFKENLGKLLMFLPELQSIETSINYTYSSEDDNTGMIRNSISSRLRIPSYNPHNPELQKITSHLDNYILQETPYGSRLKQYFRVIASININEQPMLQNYVSYNQAFGRQFFDLFQQINRFNHNFPKLSIEDMIIIMGKSKHLTSMSFASILLDLILKQCLLLIQDNTENLKTIISISQYISSCFGIDSQNAQLLTSQAKQYFHFFEAYLLHIGFKRQSSKLNLKLVSYSKYYQEFISKHLKSSYHQDIHTYHKLFSLPIQSIYDILICNEFLDLNEPILLVSIQVIYLRLFLSTLSVVRKAKVFYVSFASDFDNMIQQALIDKQEIKYIIALNPTTYQELEKMFPLLLQFFIPQKKTEFFNKISILVSIGHTIYQQALLNCQNFQQQQNFVQVFKHKLIILPQFAGALGIKRLFMGSFYLNPRKFVMLAEQFQCQVWMDFKLNDTNICGKIQAQLQAVMQNKEIRRKTMLSTEQRSVVLKSFIIGIYDLLYDELTKVFQLGSSFEQAIILRSLIQLFLYRLGVLKIKKAESDTTFLDMVTTQDVAKSAISELKQLAINNVEAIGNDSMLRVIIKQYFKSNHVNLDDIGGDVGFINDCLSFTRTRLVNMVQPNIDLAGFLQSTFQQYYDQLQNSLQLQDSLDIALQQVSQFYLSQDINHQGYGYCGSLQYQFSEQFIFDAFFNIKTHEQAFRNIIIPFVIAMWNSAQLFYITVSFSEKLTNPAAFLTRELIQKYHAFLQGITNLDNVQNISLLMLQPFCTLIADESNSFSNFKKDSVDNICLKSQQSILHNQSGLSHEQMLSIVKTQFALVIKLLPLHFCDSPFTYISFQGKKLGNNSTYSYKYIIKFMVFQFGTDFLSNVTLDDDILQTNIDIDTVCQKITQLRDQQLSDKTNTVDIDFTSIFQQVDRQGKLSLQKLSQQKIYFDSQRIAIVVMLAGCFLSPVTTSLVGLSKIGKTTLINAAQLLVRDLIDPHLIQLENTNSQFTDFAIKQSIANRFVLRNLEIRQNQRQHLSVFDFQDNKQILEYCQSLAFPTFHFHASQADSKDSITEDLLVLCRDHILKLDGKHQVKIHNSQEAISGQVSLSDASFVVECQIDSQLSQISAIQIEVPKISQHFLIELMKLQYPQHNDIWIQNFVHGFTLLKEYAKLPFFYNFEIINLMYQNRYITISKQIDIPKSNFLAYQENFIRQHNLLNLSIRTKNFKDNNDFIRNVMHNRNESILNIIQKNRDHVLQELNAQSLFFALKQLLPRQQLVKLQEKLLTIQMLYHLDNPDLPASPWSSCQSMYHYNFEILPSWKQFTLFFGLVSSDQQSVLMQNANFDSDLSVYVTQREGNYIYGLPDQVSKDLLLSLGYLKQNYRLFLNFMEIAKYTAGTLDPMVSSGVFVAYVNIMQQRELNLSRLNTFVQLGVETTNFQSLSGICSEDEMFRARQYISLFCSKYSAFVHKNIQKIKNKQIQIENFDQIYKHDCEMIGLDEIQEGISSVFGGFTYSAALSLKVPRYVIHINNSLQNPIDVITNIIKSFANYKLYHIENPQQLSLSLQIHEKLEKDFDSSQSNCASSDSVSRTSVSSSQFSHNSRKQVVAQKYYQDRKNAQLVDEMLRTKVIFNIDAILQLLESLTEEPKKQRKEYFEIMPFLYNIRLQLIKTHRYDDDKLQFILIIVILRVATALAIGVKPELVYDIDNYGQQVDYQLGVQISSQFSSQYPFKIIPEGRFIAQLPIKSASFIELRKRIDKKYKPDKYYQSKHQQLDSMTALPIEVMIVGSQQIFDLKSPTNISIISLFNNMLEPFSILPSIFSEEELQVLSILMCHNYIIETVLDRKFLSCLLASNISLLIVDSISITQQYLPCKSVGIVRSIIFEQLHKISYIYAQFSFRFQYKATTTQCFLQLFQNPNYNRFVKLACNKAKITNKEYDHNLLPQSLLDLQKLYKISDIQLPISVQFANFDFNFDQFLVQFMIASFSSFQFFNSISNLPVMSFKQFVNLGNSLTMIAFNQIKALDTTCNQIVEAESKLRQFAKYNDADVKDLELDKACTEMFQELVDKIIDKVRKQMHQNGQVFTSDLEKTQRGVTLTIICRDYFCKLRQKISSDIQQTNNILQSIALDIVGCASFMTFNLNDNLNYDLLSKFIRESEFGDLGQELKDIFQQIQVNNQDYDIFVLTYISILQQQGFKVNYSTKKSVFKTNVHNVAHYSSKFGKEQLLYNYFMITKIDSPVCQLLNEYNIDWFFSDPYHTIATSVLLAWKCGYKNFIVDKNISTVVANAIVASQQKSTNFTQYVFQSNSEQKKLSSQKENYIVYVDLSSSVALLKSQLQKAFEDYHRIILFQNVEFSTQENISVFKHLIRLKLDRSTSWLQDFILGNCQFKLNKPLNKWVVIIQSDSNNIEHILSQIGCKNLDQIDQVFYALPNLSFIRQKLPQQLKVQQQLLISIFGPESSERLRNEEIQAFETSKFLQFMILYNSLLDFNRQLVYNEQIEHYQNCTSILKENIKDLLDRIYDVVSNIVNNELILQQYISNSMVIEEIGGLHILALYRNQINYVVGSPMCLKISQCILSVVQLFQQLSAVHYPMLALQEDFLIPFLLNQLQLKVQTFSELLKEKAVEKGKIQLPDPNQFRLAELYSLQYYMNKNPLRLQELVVMTLLPLICEKLALFFDEDTLPGVWLITVSLFLSKLQKLSPDASQDIIELLPRLLSNNLNDLVRLSTSQQLANAFNPTSPFSITRLYSPTRLQQIFQITMSKTLQPEICQMSSQMQYAWLITHIIARYSVLMSNTLTWFMKNNAAFVNLSQANNPFLSIIRGFHGKNEGLFSEQQETKEFQWLQNMLFRQQYSNQVQTLPPGFNPDSISYFNSFCISCALIPEKLIENIQILSSIMQNVVGKSPFSLSQQLRQNISKQVLFYDFLQNSVEPLLSLEQQSRVFNDPFSKFASIFGDRFFDASLIENHFLLLLDFVEKQLVSDISQVSIIYYDSSIAVQVELQFILQVVINKISSQQEIKLTKSINNEIIKSNQCLILDLDFLSINQQSFEQIITNLEKVVSLEYAPVFLLLQSNAYGKDLFSAMLYPLNYNIQENEIFRSFIRQIYKLYKPSTLYLQKPQTFPDNVIHAYNILVAFYSTQYKQFSMNRKICNIKVLMLLCIQYALIQQLNITFYTDWFILNQFGIFLNKVNADFVFDKLTNHDKYARLLLSIDSTLSVQKYKQLKQIQNFIFQALIDDLDIGQLMYDGISIVITKPRSSNVNMQKEDKEDVDLKQIKRKERNDFAQDANTAEDVDSNAEEDLDTTVELDGEKQSVNENRNQDIEASELIKKREKAIVQETDVYDPLVSQLQLIGHEVSKKLNIKFLEESIVQQIVPKQRRVKLFNSDNKMLDDDYYGKENDFISPKRIFIINSDMTGIQFVKHITTLRNYFKNFQNDWFDDQIVQFDNSVCKLAAHQPLSEIRCRGIISNPLVVDVVNEILDQPALERQINLLDKVSQMPEVLQPHFRHLQEISSKPQIVFTHNDIGQYQLMHSILPNFHLDQSLIKEKYFRSYNTYYVVDASIYGQILGDIISYLKIQNALKCSASYATQRVIITAVRPYKQVRILPSGLLDLGTEEDSDVSNLRYIEITGMRLTNICYDTQLQTVCDMTTEGLQGFAPVMSLFATVVCVEGKNLHNQQPSAKNSIIVHESYVPVPLRIGGLVQPMALLENKTMFKSAEFEEKNPFFAVFPF